MSLTDKQAAFVEHYFACGFNATRAAKAAGYSEKTAAQQGYQLLQISSVRAAIDARFGLLATDAEEMRRVLVRELVVILSSDLAGLVEWDDDGMRLVPSADLTPEQSRSLKEVSLVIQDGVTRSKVGLHDKVRAADLLARLHGLLREKLEVSGNVGITVGRLHELAAGEGGDEA